MSDIDFSEACGQLILIFQEESLYLDEYQLMMMTFIEAMEDDETMRMAVALAKQAVSPEHIKEVSDQIDKELEDNAI